MAITSEIIGKLGGADVETVDVYTPSKSGVSILKHIEVPAGKTLLVAVKGTASRNSTGLAGILIRADDTTVGGTPLNSSATAGVAILTEGADISVDMGSSAASFTGRIYTVEM